MAIAINEHVPPLAAGDHLTRDEFLRRWAADPSIKFAELIRNVVYMSSPVFVDRGGVENEALRSPAHEQFVAQLAAQRKG